MFFSKIPKFQTPPAPPPPRLNNENRVPLVKISSPEEPEDPPSQHDHRDQDAGELQHGNFVATLRHAAQPPGTAFDGCREGGEDFVLGFLEAVISFSAQYADEVTNRMGEEENGFCAKKS